MALKLTVESFLQVVRQSGLIDKDQLQKLLTAYEQRGVDVTRSQTIADALVSDELVTKWQVDKLLAGKHKGFFLGKYRLLDLLGKGGMSSVYLAEHILMRRRCAIKVLPSKRVNDSSYLARFHREAQAVASVDHPNIVRAYDVDHAQDRDAQIHFLVMEYVAGRSLQEMVMQDGPSEFADAVEYIRQAGEGLEHAHRAGLVHRDIKPGNLLVDTTGTLKILDMGLARFFDDRDENPLTVAHDEKVLGTADYLAPEQALDSHTADQRADIYSLGCSLYFLLTGHPPFTEGTLAQRLMWHQVKEFSPLTDARLDCPSSLMTLLNRMVAKKPEDRFQSAAETAEACARWLSENASPDWRLKHVPDTRSTGSKTKLASPTRDLRSDSQAMSGNGSSLITDSSPLANKSSSIISDDLSSSSATKISKATQSESPLTALSAASVPPPAIPVATVAPSVTPPAIAQPVIAPPVITPPVAKPVIPVAAPVVPIARPIAPPLPVATPVVAVAQPMSPLAVTTLIVPTLLVRPPSTTADEETHEFSFGQESESSSEPEATTDGDLFSLFGGGSDVSPSEETVTQPETAPLTNSAEATSIELTQREIQPDSEQSSVEEFGSAVEPPAVKAVTKPAALTKLPLQLSRHDWKQPKVLVVVVAAIIVLGVGTFWMMSSGPNKKESTKLLKKSGSTVAKSTGPSAKKTDAYEVTIHVGHSSEFSNIGRAVQSILENRTEHETKAGGKPLRFIINVTPGQPFEESLVLDETFPGELHLKSANNTRVKLVPSGNDPVISIKNLNHVTIENFSIDLSAFPPKETGIVLSGTVSDCHIKQTVISGFGKAGVVLAAAKGGGGADAIQLEGVTFQNASPTAFGIHIAKGELSQQVTLQRCRFIGSLSAALFAEGSIESLTLRNCAFSGGQSSAANGLHFSTGVSAKNLLIEHCSFASLGGSAILFDDMPASGSDNLSWRNNLFAGVKGAELLIKQNYDAKKFDALLSSEKPIANNWCDRPSPNPVPGERDLLGEGGSRVSSIEFASMDSKTDLYLTPKPNTPYKSAGVMKPSK